LLFKLSSKRVQKLGVSCRQRQSSKAFRILVPSDAVAAGDGSIDLRSWRRSAIRVMMTSSTIFFMGACLSRTQEGGDVTVITSLATRKTAIYPSIRKAGKVLMMRLSSIVGNRTSVLHVRDMTMPDKHHDGGDGVLDRVTGVSVPHQR
jgi:hypothetical protein